MKSINPETIYQSREAQINLWLPFGYNRITPDSAVALDKMNLQHSHTADRRSDFSGILPEQKQ